MGLPGVCEGAAWVVMDTFRHSLARSQCGYICETHLAHWHLLTFACISGHCRRSSESSLKLALSRLCLWGLRLDETTPWEFDSWGFILEAKLLDAESFLFSFWVILMRSKNPEHKCSTRRTKTLLVSSMGTLNSHRCNDWSECSELCFLLQFTVPTLSGWNNAMILFIYFSSHWTQYCFFLISCAFLCDLFEVIFPMLQLFYSLF